MSDVDDDVRGAIPDDDTPRPPISGPDDQPQPPQPPQTEMHEGIPEIGEAPYRQLGRKMASDIGEGFTNAGQNAPARFAKAALGQAIAPNPEDGSPGILGYLLGGTTGGGADPETASKFALPDKHKGASDDDANLLAVQKAYELGGPEAAWAMVQFNRGAYNANMSFAKHAASGVDGKPADDHAAADAATKASKHMLDGSSVHYTAASGGFLATIKMPGTSQIVQIPLGKTEFIQAMDPMGEGQYDKVIEQGGMPSHLQRMVKSNVGSTPSSQGGDLSGGVRPSEYPVNPAVKDKDGNVTTPEYQTKGPGYNSQQEEDSRARFPWISQERERYGWIDQQNKEEAERETKETVAKETGIARNKTAEIQAGGHRDVQHEKSATFERVANQEHGDRVAALKQKADLEVKRLQTQARNADERNRAANFGRLLAAGPFTSDEDVKKRAAQAGVQLSPAFSAPQAATPQAGDVGRDQGSVNQSSGKKPPPGWVKVQ